MIISIDHGNKQIKTLNRTFTSGLLERDSRPAFGEDILCYEGKYYTLSYPPNPPRIGTSLQT